jgi:arylsulfatase A-like enzyme/Tfp pilus assembly protein PilF
MAGEMARKRKKSKERQKTSTATARAPAPPPRRRNRWLVPGAVVIVLGVSVWAIWSLSAGGFERQPLNVVIVTADTLRADKLACYGNTGIATPHLDGLAASGVLFEHATTVTPLTLPAHSSIFTGTYPMYHGVRDNGGYYLDTAQITLAEILKEQGYSTGAFVAAFVLDSRWGLDQGFDRYFDDFDLSKYEQVSLDSVQRRGDEVLDKALEWMDTVRSQRFFSWIHFYDPHTPFDPPEPYRSRYQGVRWGLYDGEVAFVDDLVGRLTDWLDDKGLSDNTIVVFMGDHGESLGDHREINHGFFIYDATIAVPLILKTPYRKLQGRRVDAQVRSIDVMPTLLDLLGFEAPEAVQGESLLDLCAGRDDDLGLVAYSESLYPRHHYGWSDLKSIRDGTFHFIDSPRPELYDVHADPSEKNNLAEVRPDEVRDLERRLEEIVERYSAEGIEDKGPETLDRETEAQLAALGYLGGPSKINVDPTAPLADPKDKIEAFNLIKQAGSDSSEGRLEDAFAKIRRVLADDPNILEAHLILGNLYNKQNEPDKAIEAYKEALARDPEYKSALFSLATTYQEMGREDDAAAGFQRVLELDPRNSRAYIMLARIHANRKEHDQAVELLSKAVELGGEMAPTHNLMAECYIELGMLSEAEKEVLRALEMQEKLPTAHYNLALIREERGDIRGAIEAYEKEIEIAPKNDKAHFNLAKLYGSTGRPEKQMEHLLKAVEANEKLAEAHLYLAKMYLDRGELDHAVSSAKRGIELGPDREMAPLGHFILADAYNRLGRIREAEEEVAKAHRLQ